LGQWHTGQHLSIQVNQRQLSRPGVLDQCRVIRIDLRVEGSVGGVGVGHDDRHHMVHNHEVDHPLKVDEDARIPGDRF
jgi:hypothetical protein